MYNKNTGVVILNGDCSAMPHKTVIVLGVARGGTSMVAGTLSKLGVFMGKPESLAPFYEDQDLAVCLKNGNKQQAKKLVHDYNNKYAIWGTKNPSKRLWHWRAIFREPVYVVVFRDVLASSNRWVVSLNKSLFLEMLKAIGQNLFLLTFLRLSKRPVLMVSYEKALLFPEDFVDALAGFLGIDDHSKQDEAIEFIKPSPSAYLKRATTSAQLDATGQWFGYVDSIETHKIVGWALSTVDTTALTIELIVNGSRSQTTIANLLRVDVAEVDKRFHAQCGFEFEISEQNALKEGDKVEVKIAGQALNLINSPAIIRQTTA